RDGTQGEDANFSVRDKLRIAKALDDLGISYIEGGWPGSNPRDAEFFEAAQSQKLRHAKYAAFGSTRRPKIVAAQDPGLQALVLARTPVVSIFGKTWDMQVTVALGVSLEENLELIHDSLRYLKGKVERVFYDAEHFFDAFAA